MRVRQRCCSSLVRNKTAGSGQRDSSDPHRGFPQRSRLYLSVQNSISILPLRLAALTVAYILMVNLAWAQVLTHGPVVGGVTATDAKVFVRTDQSASVALRYGTDPNLETYLVSDAVLTNYLSDFTAIIPLVNLTAETTYYLNVVVNDVPQFSSQPYPTFTTFPPSGTSRNFNFVVLTDFETVSSLTSSVQTFASAASQNPAFVFIGGDFDHRNPVTLADKRQMFKDLYDPHTRFMSHFAPLILRRSAIIHQWDDHDSGLNNLDKNYPNWNLTQRAFQEYVPTYPLPSVTPGIWQKFSYAQIDFFVLDCRSQRDPGADPDGPDKSMLDGNALGPTGELQWLKDGLLASSARWKIIFTSVITNPTTKWNDAWGAYQTEWNSLRSFIETNNIQSVVFIAGDLHIGAIDNGTAAGFPEMVIQKANDMRVGECATGGGDWSEGTYDDTCSGYGMVTVLQDPDRLSLQVADQFGVVHVSYTVPAPDYSLSISPSSVRVDRGGGTAVYTVTINPTNGFNSAVTFSVSGLPSGTTGSFDPNPATTTSTLTLTVDASTARGNYVFTVTGMGGSPTLTRTATATLKKR